MLETIASTAPSLGGDDTITTGGGNDTILGGIADDTIDAGTGDNIVFGDNGLIRYDGADNDMATLDLLQTTAPEVGGGMDDITTGAGNDFILGGDNIDTINAGDGNNVILGDMGRIELHSARLDLITSTETGQGGDDVIVSGMGNDTAVAGYGADEVTSTGGNNVVLGDNGTANFGFGGNWDIASDAGSGGGADEISGGAEVNGLRAEISALPVSRNPWTLLRTFDSSGSLMPAIA